MAMKESELMSQIINYFNAVGICYYRINTQGIMHTIGGRTVRKKNPNKGMADFLVTINGFTIWIEAKTDIGKQSPEQKEFQAKAEQNGAMYLLARTLEIVKEVVESVQEQLHESKSC